MRWALVGLATLAALGCSDARPGRYQLVPESRLVFDTQTGRLCLAVVPSQDTGNLSAAQLCDPTLFNPRKMVDSLAIIMASCRDTLTAPSVLADRVASGRARSGLFDDLYPSDDPLASAYRRWQGCRALAENRDGIDPEILKRAREREATRTERGRTPQ